jgi:hypothetical protein
MAQTSSNIILEGLRGQIGKQLVVKQYGRKTVISAYPDMSRIRPSPRQHKRRGLFSEAVRFAQGIIHDPAKNELYQQKLGKGRSVFHYAIAEYLEKAKNEGRV